MYFMLTKREAKFENRLLQNLKVEKKEMKWLAKPGPKFRAQAISYIICQNLWRSLNIIKFFVANFPIYLTTPDFEGHIPIIRMVYEHSIHALIKYCQPNPLESLIDPILRSNLNSYLNLVCQSRAGFGNVDSLLWIVKRYFDFIDKDRDHQQIYEICLSRKSYLACRMLMADFFCSNRIELLKLAISRGLNKFVFIFLNKFAFHHLTKHEKLICAFNVVTYCDFDCTITLLKQSVFDLVYQDERVFSKLINGNIEGLKVAVCLSMDYIPSDIGPQELRIVNQLKVGLPDKEKKRIRHLVYFEDSLVTKLLYYLK